MLMAETAILFRTFITHSSRCAVCSDSPAEGLPHFQDGNCRPKSKLYMRCRLAVRWVQWVAFCLIRLHAGLGLGGFGKSKVVFSSQQRLE